MLQSELFSFSSWTHFPFGVQPRISAVFFSSAPQSCQRSMLSFPSEDKALLPHRGSTDAGDSRRDWWCSNALLHGYSTETNIANQRRRIFCMTPRNMPMIDHLLLNRSAWDASCESVRRITSQPDQAGSECLRTMFNHQKGYPQRVIHNMSRWRLMLSALL